MLRRLVLLLLLCTPAFAQQPQPTYLYRATLVQAAPGKLLELIDLYKSHFAALSAAHDEAPMWMRHSQGDHWDLLILTPMESYAAYYAPARVAARPKLPQSITDDIAWQEDLFAVGPPLETVRSAFNGAGYFHVEMFEALPGRNADLYHEREMENAYSKQLNQPQNLIFIRDSGAAWTNFTIGFFRDLKHYAESATSATPEQQQAAAKAAGFEDSAHIGPYLRTLIRTHHDTLATAIK